MKNGFPLHGAPALICRILWGSGHVPGVLACVGCERGSAVDPGKEETTQAQERFDPWNPQDLMGQGLRDVTPPIPL